MLLYLLVRDYFHGYDLGKASTFSIASCRLVLYLHTSIDNCCQTVLIELWIKALALFYAYSCRFFPSI